MPFEMVIVFTTLNSNYVHNIVSQTTEVFLWEFRSCPVLLARLVKNCGKVQRSV